MPSFTWIGKEKIVNHDKDVPFRLLKKNKKYSLGNSENLILEGDNLEALKALMPFYYGKIKCIYIDPPYNTGNEKWVYNDKVNSPKIKEWLGKVVGSEGDDLCRHDKWLCMMYPRLKLLRELLSDDGVIFVSIDDNEVYHLRILLNEIFGEDNFVSELIWNNSTGGGLRRKYINICHEYILAFAKNIEALDMLWAPLSHAGIEQYRKKDKKGIYREQQFAWQNKSTGKNQKYPIEMPDGTKIIPKNGYIYRFVEESFKELLKEGVIVFKKTPKGVYQTIDGERTSWSISVKDYIGDGLTAPVSILPKEYVKMNIEAINETRELFGKKIFDYPKPSTLLKYLFKIITGKNDIILDSFAGSGTTGHAVLDLNKEDGGNRKFILVEMEKDIAKNITAERVKRVARGYSYKKSNGEIVKVAGLGGGFEFVELGEPLFDKDGTINKAVSFDDMAQYVYFTETRTNLEKKNIKGNYLGEFGSSHYFLLFDGIGKNVLDRKFLRELKGVAGKKIIYADKCLLDEEVLEKNQIIFKQIPYEVKVY